MFSLMHCHMGTPHQSCLYIKLAPATYGIKIRNIKNSQKLLEDVCHQIKICAKRTSLSFTLCGEIFAFPILTVTEICAKRKSWSLTLCGKVFQFQSWLWQKSVQKEKSWYFLHCVVRFCTSNADLDRNLFKNFLFYTRWWHFCTPNLDLDRNLCKKKKLRFCSSNLDL